MLCIASVDWVNKFDKHFYLIKFAMIWGLLSVCMRSHVPMSGEVKKAGLEKLSILLGEAISISSLWFHLHYIHMADLLGITRLFLTFSFINFHNDHIQTVELVCSWTRIQIFKLDVVVLYSKIRLLKHYKNVNTTNCTFYLKKINQHK